VKLFEVGVSLVVRVVRCGTRCVVLASGISDATTLPPAELVTWMLSALSRRPLTVILAEQPLS
jgi:hypothetical protein